MSRMLFAYFGPETLLPLTSVLAAVAGFVLMFGRQVFRVARFVTVRAVRLMVPASVREKASSTMMGRNLRRDAPARSRYRRPAHHENEVRS